MPRIRLLFWALSAACIAGCGVEKAPPTVAWLTPTDGVSWAVSQNVPLRFTLTDPAPETGAPGPTTWRVDIGPESGGVWWSTSGTLSAPEDGLSRTDTLHTSWSTPADFAGGSAVTLRLTAIAEDAQGQRAAAFREAQLFRPPLTAERFWSLQADNPAHLTAWEGGNATDWPWTGSNGNHLLHLDGQDLLLIGGTELEARNAGNGTLGAPLWSRSSPAALLGDHVRLLRRNPAEEGAAQALVGWGDRIERLRADGLATLTWLLLDGETLLDAARIGESMIALVRTAQSEWRLVRFNADNGARMDAVTWTPEASGSQGPEGRGWLIALGGDPAALESDGRARRWFSEANGSTGLTTEVLAGEGSIQHAGLLEDGRCWISRNTTRLHDGEVQGAPLYPTPLLHISENRAEGTWALLTQDAEGVPDAWQILDAGSLAPLFTLAAEPGTRSGTHAHNRPGPP